MIRPVLKYGVPQLRERSRVVETFDTELERLGKDLFETMYAEGGVGLAAPQIGVNLRLIVCDVSGAGEKGKSFSLVNPEVISQEGKEKSEEGCLSIPGFSAIVERPIQVGVKALSLWGDVIQIEAKGLLARALCHEIDHLDGILYLDRISRLKRDLIKRKIRKLVKAGKWG